MTDILENLESRQVSTLDLPADKNKWPVTVTVQELDALIRVARAAKVLHELINRTHSPSVTKWELLKARGELGLALHDLGELASPAAEMVQLQQDLGLDD